MADKDEAEPTSADADAAAGSRLEGSSADTELTGEADAELTDETDAESVPVEREPATVGARSGSSVRPGGAAATTKPKGTPTARRDTPPERERTTPPKFVRQSVEELRKVVYPTGPQLGNYFVVVLVFVLFIIAFVSLFDLAFGQAVFKLFS